MLQYLLNVTNTLLCMALLVAMLAVFVGAYLDEFSKKIFKYAITAGIFAALTLTILKLSTGLVVQEYYDIAILALLIPLELIFILVLILRFHNATLGVVLAFVVCGNIAYTVPAIFLYPFEFSVGMDNIFNTDFVLKTTGYIFSLGVVMFAMLSLAKVSLILPKKVFFKLLMATIAIMLCKQLLAASYIILGRDMIPRYDWLMELVIFVGGNSQVFVFVMVMIAAIPAVKVNASSINKQFSGDNRAQIRKQIAESRRQVRWSCTLLISLVLSIFFITVCKYLNEREIEISPPTEVYAVDGKITLPLSDFDDRHLHRYNIATEDGGNVRFIIIKKPKAGYGVGLDACDVCGQTGYYERKNQVVCKMCDVVMNIATIGFAGGCNPVPLHFELVNGEIVIRIDDINAEAHRFR